MKLDVFPLQFKVKLLGLPLAIALVALYHHPLLALRLLLLGCALVALLSGVAFGLYCYFWNGYQYKRRLNSHRYPEPESVYLGRCDKKRSVFMPASARSSHTQVIGSTNAGKSESIILPWAITDIENGNGLLIIDGKSDSSFRDKLYSYVCKANRQDDFRFFSLAAIDESHTFNPLSGAQPHEVCERVFASFPIENPHYRAVQSSIFHCVLSLIAAQKVTPTFALVSCLLSSPDVLAAWNMGNSDPQTKEPLDNLLQLSRSEFLNVTSGLQANIAHFTQGTTSVLFNDLNPQITFDEVMSRNLICYFQLPTMFSPVLAEATGKLVLQTFAHAVSRRHLGKAASPNFFSCYLDDFQDYLYPGFGSLLNKSRSANVGVVFSHQALGDLDKVGPHFKNVVVSSTNVKVVMRTIDPDTCDFYARAIGTETSEKVTERQTRSWFWTTKTGEGSAREVEKYIVHPKELRSLKRGQGVVTIPNPLGVNTVRVSFQMRPAIAPVDLPIVKKTSLDWKTLALPPSLSTRNS